MNGYRCFNIHHSRIFHFKHRCWHRFTVYAVVPQVERENFSITLGTHCRRPNKEDLGYTLKKGKATHGCFFNKCKQVRHLEKNIATTRVCWHRVRVRMVALSFRDKIPFHQTISPCYIQSSAMQNISSSILFYSIFFHIL